MAEPLKTAGLRELARLRKRVRNQRAWGRIGRNDSDYIEERLNEVEARIINMTEQDKSGKDI